MLAPPKPPPQDELEALIKEARARQLRRRLLGAAGVAIAAAVGLGAYALVTGGSADRTPGALPNVPGNAPRCRASQFSSSAGLNGGAFGTMDGTVILTNTSASACSLPTGRPDVSVLWQGQVLPTRDAAMQGQSGKAIPVLAPHSGAAIDLAWTNWCGKPGLGTTSDPTFRLSWPAGLVVDVPNGISVRPRCDGGGPAIVVVGRPYKNRLLAP